ncbi:MAG: TnsD family Tn7-like transposition protein [Colwellia sp.]|jgi:hypothetical protein
MNQLVWFPGECAYSLVARAYLQSPYCSWGETNKTLFNVRHVRINVMLPGRLTAFAELTNHSIDEVRVKATGHVLFALGLVDIKSRERLINASTETGDKSFGSSLLAVSKLTFSHQIKACPLCAVLDEAEYGVPYWHIIHQYYGVSVCPKHNAKLVIHKTGEGGINRQYILPLWEKDEKIKSSNKAEELLSLYIAKLHDLLCEFTPITPLNKLYQQWLSDRELLTTDGHIRWRILKPQLLSYWQSLFCSFEPVLPLELKGFRFVPNMVHKPRNMHYIKHVLLMAFLSETPEEFFNGPAEAEKECEVKGKPVRNIEKRALELLFVGNSMRSVASQLSCSIGYLKQLALRNHIEVERRRQSISADIERTVWRKAFYGIHRGVIANELDISIGAVEQIIQSHQGLSQWRHHLLMVRRLMARQKELLAFTSTHQGKARNYIKEHCGAYMWLYKNDKDWLYQHLPPAQSKKHYPSVDWSARDIVLVAQLMSLKPTYSSLSQIDRELGGHGWLLQYRGELPRASAFAQELLDNKLNLDGE